MFHFIDNADRTFNKLHIIMLTVETDAPPSFCCWVSGAILSCEQSNENTHSIYPTWQEINNTIFNFVYKMNWNVIKRFFSNKGLVYAHILMILRIFTHFHNRWCAIVLNNNVLSTLLHVPSQDFWNGNLNIVRSMSLTKHA